MKIITEDKLATLTNRVTKTIPVLGTLDAEKMWQHPLEQFYKVADNPNLIDSIILEENRVASIYSGRIRNSHVSLACIYILLYYCNRNDTFYKQFVFSELAKNMGIFGSDHLNKINERIDRILLMDNAFEEEEARKKKDMKPLFRLPELSEVEYDELDKEFSKESLYRMITPIIDTLGLDHLFYPNMPQLWKAAKEIMLFFDSVEYPYHFVPKILAKIDAQYGSIGDIHGQLLMLCIYGMLRSVKDNWKMLHVISKIEEYKTNNLTKYAVLKMSIGALKDAFDDSNVKWFDGYDYTQAYQKSGILSNPAETLISDRLKVMQNLLDQKEDELNNQKGKYEKKIGEQAQRISELEKTISEMPSPDLKLKIGENRKTDFIKIFYSLVQLKVIIREDGHELTQKDAMMTFGTLLSDKTIADYSSIFSGANNTSDLNYFKILGEIKDVLQDYRDKAKRKKNSK